MLCRKGSTRKCRGSVPVYLNVYDLTPVNGYAYWLGLGVYHSGVQVHGVEYAFGAHEYPTTGIFEGEPKQCDGFSFRKSILIGWTDVSPEEVRGIMGEFAEEYKGNAYNLITKNCNHFCNDACIRLTANPIPSWVNRLARIGFFCNCLLPMSISTTRLNIRHNGREEKADEAEKKKLRSPSNRLTSSSNSSSSSSLSPSGNAVQTSRGRSRTRRTRTRTRTHPPPSPLILDSPSST